MSSEHDGFLVASYAQGLKEQLDSVRAELERVTRERDLLAERIDALTNPANPFYATTHAHCADEKSRLVRTHKEEMEQAEADLSEALELLRELAPNPPCGTPNCDHWVCRAARLRERHGK